MPCQEVFLLEFKGLWRQMLTKDDEGGRGVKQILTIDDEGGSEKPQIWLT